MYFFTINRNEKLTTCHSCGKKTPYPRSILRHGEFHWYYSEPSHIGGSLSWLFFSHFCHLSLDFSGSEREIRFSFALPWLFAIWVHHYLPPALANLLPQHHFRHQNPQTGEIIAGSYPEDRSIDFRIHSWALWWTIWHDDGTWSSTDPWYRRGSFHLLDFLFGRTECETATHPRTHDGHVQLPEGFYPVRITTEHRRWWRRRWSKNWPPFARAQTSHDVTSDIGIPFPGKGENSWDCDDDALHGCSFVPKDPSDFRPTLDHVRQVVLDYRERYGGLKCRLDPWPESPADRLQRITALRAENAQKNALAAPKSTQNGAL